MGNAEVKKCSLTAEFYDVTAVKDPMADLVGQVKGK